MKLDKFFKDKPIHVSDNNTYFFLKQQENKSYSGQRDIIDLVKDKAKLILGPLYMIGIYLFSPVMPRIKWRKKKLFVNYLIEKYTCKKGKLSLQVGGGVNNTLVNTVNLDIFNYSGINVVADAEKLPFKNLLFDNYISIAVLEHVVQPEVMISEAFRVLKKGGIIISGVPFIQGFHASPHDYTRWTNAGLESIHKRHGFKKIGIFPIAGPASALVWILIDFFSLIFSIGIRGLYYFWFTIFSIVFLPIKLIDIFLVLHPESYRIASFTLYIGKKV